MRGLWAQSMVQYWEFRARYIYREFYIYNFALQHFTYEEGRNPAGEGGSLLWASVISFDVSGRIYPVCIAGICHMFYRLNG